MSDLETAPVHVLVVDDEPAICRIVSHTLKRNGFVPGSVSDPGQIENALEQASYDIVLLDRSMGTVPGKTLLPVLREKAPQAKVLYFTGELVDEEELRMVDGVVQKPVNGKELTQLLRDVL